MSAPGGFFLVTGLVTLLAGCATNQTVKMNAKATDERPVAAREQSTVAVEETRATSVIDPLHPRPAAYIKKSPVRPAASAENKFGTTNIGPTAVSALWRNYGAYFSRMIESVQVQWELLLPASKAYPAAGSKVTVTFIMDSSGEIARIVSVESTAGDIPARACVSAITKPAPFGAWTSEMKAVLGAEQQMTFTFFYQ